MSEEELRRKRFEQFNFSLEGHDLHSKMCSNECSANWYAYEIWKACEVNLIAVGNLSFNSYGEYDMRLEESVEQSDGEYDKLIEHVGVGTHKMYTLRNPNG
jgi:hypothetical protein